jgi:phosphatidylglycerol:prolipoprotein diacylglycerol transferase
VITQPLFLGTLTPYAILLSCCAGLGLYLSFLVNKGDLPHLIDGGIVLVFVSALGSRLSFVLLNFDYYKDHLLEIPQFWLGGMSWPGAILGAALSVFLIHWIWKEPLGELTDSYLPLLGTLVLGIWLAGWGAGIGYGPKTEAWFGIHVKDIFGTVEKRWPMPILGALLSGVWTVGVMLFPLKRQRPAGTRGLLGIFGLLAVNALLSFFRVDPAPSWLGLRLESWISLVLLAVVLAGFIYLTKEEIGQEGPAS